MSDNLKYLLTYEDTDSNSFGYDKYSGMGPGVITHKVIKKRMFDTKQEALSFSNECFVKDNNPKIYECKQI